MIYKLLRASIIILQDKDKYGQQKCTAIQASLMLCIFIVLLFSLSHLNRYLCSSNQRIAFHVNTAAP